MNSQAIAQTIPQVNQERIAGYLESILTQRKLSPHTVSSYRIDLLELAVLTDTLDIAALKHGADFSNGYQAKPSWRATRSTA